MDFSLTEAQNDVQQLAAKILADFTSNEHLRAVENQPVRFDQSLMNEIATAGLLGLAIDEVYGGLGLGFETLCLLLEEAGKTVAPLPLVDNLVTASMSLQQFADETIKTTVLPKVASGEIILAAGLFDGQAIDSSLNELELQGLKLSGCKSLVGWAQQADKILLKVNSLQGAVIVLVDTHLESISFDAQQSTTGEPIYVVHFDNMLITNDQIIAEGIDTDLLCDWIRPRTLTAHCAMAVGVTAKMLQMTAAYTTEREQFGVPIATFQAVAHRAADCYVDVENLRLVTQQAITHLDQGHAIGDEVLIAKIWCGDVCHRVSQASQHLHGGVGVDRDYPLFRYCLWAKQLEMTMGSSNVYLNQLGDQIAKHYKAAATG